jgi:hypothetical protein
LDSSIHLANKPIEAADGKDAREQVHVSDLMRCEGQQRGETQVD